MLGLILWASWGQPHASLSDPGAAQARTTLAKQHAGDIPVMVCVGSVRIDAILHLADDAQAAVANVLLLPAGRYQSLRDEEVFSRFEAVTGTCLYQCVSLIIRARRILPLRTNSMVVSHHLRVLARSCSLTS